MAGSQRPRILIIEDSEFYAKLLHDILCKDFSTHIELSGQSGLDYANSFLPDIIILDVDMPEMNGYEVIKKLKSSEHTKDIPVIFVSGLDDAYSEEKGLSLGAADYIVKPISASVVLLRVNNQLKIIQQQLTEYDLLRHKLVTNALNLALWDKKTIEKVLFNSDNKIEWSDKFRNMLGFSDEKEFPNTFGSLNDRLHPDDLQILYDCFSKHLNDYSGKTPFDIECRVKARDGQYKFFRMLGSTLRNNEGAPISVAGALIDITELKTMEKELKVVEELNRIMLDSSPLCCQLWDESINIVDCNEAAVKLFEFKDRNDFINNFLEKRCGVYQPDGRFSAEKAQTLIKQVFISGEDITTEWTYVMPDGSQMPSEVTFVRVDYRGSYLVAAYTRDLRELVNMEHRIIFLESEAEKAYHDALTGAYNRRYLDTNLKNVLDNMSRSGNILSLLMIDIDFFKNYNDTYGHDEGDKCLIAVAEVLMEGVKRKGDFVARYGGEEFTVVMPDTDEAGARLMAEKLLNEIWERKIPHISSPISDYVTVSIGAVTGKVFYDRTGADYIKRADKMLYISKQIGRNRITHESF